MLTIEFPDYPSPRWFAGRGERHSGIVQADGSIAAWDRLTVVLEGTLPPAGTELVIQVGDHHLIAQTREEVDAAEASARAAYEARMNEARRRENDRLRAAEERAHQVNGNLRLPVRWTSGYKPVLSGLSASSMGDGTNRRTVTHILLLEPLGDGRLCRPAHALLCTSASGTDGKRWTNPATYGAGVNGRYVAEITCKQCLALARRWADAPQWQPAELAEEARN